MGSGSMSSVRAVSGGSVDERGSGSGSGTGTSASGGAGSDSAAAALLKAGAAPMSRGYSGTGGSGGLFSAASATAVGGAGAGAAAGVPESASLPGAGIGFHLVQAAFMHAVAATQVRGPEGHEENLLMPINIVTSEPLGRKRRRLYIPATDPAAGPVAYGNPGGVPLLVVPVVPHGLGAAAAKQRRASASGAAAARAASGGAGSASPVPAAARALSPAQSESDPSVSTSRSSSAAGGHSAESRAESESASGAAEGGACAPPRFVLPPMFDADKLVAKRLLSEAAKTTQANAVEAGLGAPCCEHRVVGTAAGGAHPCPLHSCPLDVPPALQSRMHVLCEPVHSHVGAASSGPSRPAAGAGAASERGPVLQPSLQSSASSAATDPQAEAAVGSGNSGSALLPPMRGMLQCSVGLDSRYYWPSDFAAELSRIRASFAGNATEAAAAQKAQPIQPRCQVIED